MSDTPTNQPINQLIDRRTDRVIGKLNFLSRLLCGTDMTICLPILLQSYNPYSLLLFSIKLSTTGNLCHKMPVWHAPPCNLSLFIVSIFFVCIVHVCTGEKEKRPGHWWCWHTRIYRQQASLSLLHPGPGLLHFDHSGEELPAGW